MTDHIIEARRQFLGSTFRSLAERDALAGEVLSSLSGDLLLDWLDEVEGDRGEDVLRARRPDPPV